MLTAATLCGQCSSCWPYGQNVARECGDEPFCYASEHRAAQSSSAVRADNHEIGAELLDVVPESGFRGTNLDSRCQVGSHDPRCLDKLLHRFLCERPHLVLVPL